jgi:hypothetical protein
MAYRRQTFLSASVRRSISMQKTLPAPKQSGQIWPIRSRMILSQCHGDLLCESKPLGLIERLTTEFVPRRN